MLPADSVLFMFGLVAMVAEAMTAALAAGRRKMDWFGVAMLGAITALGGGSVRDVLLGHYPLLWVKHPMLLVLTGVSALLTIALAQVIHRFHSLFLVLDAIGLVDFTIIGCNVALSKGQPLTIVVVAGMITGCVGGVLRDMLCTEIPLLFRSELYATVSLTTGAIYVAATRYGLNHVAVVIGAFIIGLTFRLLAIRYKWEMPKFIYERETPPH
jgi:uncharacterized membrane protein YeiH